MNRPLISYKQFKDMAGKSVNVDLDDEKVIKAITEAIGSASQMIYTYLDHPLYVASIVQFSDDPQAVWVPAVHPVVEVTDGTVRGNKIVTDKDVDFISYRAGYYSIPVDIQRVCYRIAMYEFQQSREGTYGVSTRTIETGGVSANITRMDSNFIPSELAKLAKYQNKSYYIDYEVVA
jgi:hypothetical protein